MLELILHDLLRQTEERLSPSRYYPQPDALGYVKMPSYDEAIKNEEALREIAEVLYQREVPELEMEEKRYNHKGVRRVEVGEKDAFYLKKSWEYDGSASAAAKEALGMTLSNLLIVSPFEFRFYGKTVAIKEIRGKTVREMARRQRRYLHQKDYAQAYGEAIELTEALQLGDRSDVNLIYDGRRLINIDFGQLFKGKYGLAICEPSKMDALQKGRLATRNKITKVIQERQEEIVQLLQLAEQHGGPRAEVGLEILEDYLNSNKGIQ